MALFDPSGSGRWSTPSARFAAKLAASVAMTRGRPAVGDPGNDFHSELAPMVPSSSITNGASSAGTYASAVVTTSASTTHQLPRGRANATVLVVAAEPAAVRATRRRFREFNERNGKVDALH